MSDPPPRRDDNSNFVPIVAGVVVGAGILALLWYFSGGPSCKSRPRKADVNQQMGAPYKCDCDKTKWTKIRCENLFYPWFYLRMCDCEEAALLARQKSKEKKKEAARKRKALHKKHASGTQTEVDDDEEEEPFDWTPYIKAGVLLSLICIPLIYRYYDNIKRFIYGDPCEPCQPCGRRPKICPKLYEDDGASTKPTPPAEVYEGEKLCPLPEQSLESGSPPPASSDTCPCPKPPFSSDPYSHPSSDPYSPRSPDPRPAPRSSWPCPPPPSPWQQYPQTPSPWQAYPPPQVPPSAGSPEGSQPPTWSPGGPTEGVSQAGDSPPGGAPAPDNATGSVYKSCECPPPKEECCCPKTKPDETGCPAKLNPDKMKWKK